MANERLKIRSFRDPYRLWGHGHGAKPLTQNIKCGSRQKQRKKLPLISHKTVANRMDTFTCWVRNIGGAPMGHDDETHLHETYANHFDMDEAFCARMRAAIGAGQESAPVGVTTTPGTRNPKFVPTKQVVRFSCQS